MFGNLKNKLAMMAVLADDRRGLVVERCQAVQIRAGRSVPDPAGGTQGIGSCNINYYSYYPFWLDEINSQIIGDRVDVYWNVHKKWVRKTRYAYAYGFPNGSECTIMEKNRHDPHGRMVRVTCDGFRGEEWGPAGTSGVWIFEQYLSNLNYF